MSGGTRTARALKHSVSCTRVRVQKHETGRILLTISNSSAAFDVTVDVYVDEDRLLGESAVDEAEPASPSVVVLIPESGESCGDDEDDD
jgi:hypothetical protein